MSLTLGILQADSVIEHLQPQHGDFPAMIETVLSRAAARQGVGLSFSIYDVLHGDYPGDLHECTAYLITGSRQSVYDQDPWITKLGDYVRQLHQARKKTIGICFGHQLVAHFLGGRVESAAAGWGVGIHASRVVKQAGFMQPALDEYHLVVSHRDQVVALPEGATLLASSDFCPHAMYQLDDHIVCLQGHPEFAADYSAALIDYRKEIIGEDKHRAGLDSLDGPLSREQVGEWIVRFLLDQG